MHRVGCSFVQLPDQPSLARQMLGTPSSSGAPCSVHGGNYALPSRTARAADEKCSRNLRRVRRGPHRRSHRCERPARAGRGVPPGRYRSRWTRCHRRSASREAEAPAHRCLGNLRRPQGATTGAMSSGGGKVSTTETTSFADRLAERAVLSPTARPGRTTRTWASSRASRPRSGCSTRPSGCVELHRRFRRRGLRPRADVHVRGDVAAARRRAAGRTRAS